MILYILILIILLSIIFWQACLIFVVFQGAPTVYAWDEAMLDTIRLAKPKTGETLLDLGCGNAKSLILASKKFGLKGIGVEISPFCFLKSKWNVFLAGESNNIKIILADLTKAEKHIKKADIIYLYLLAPLLEKIEPIIFSRKEKNCRVVSLAFKFKDKAPAGTFRTKNLGIITSSFLYK